MIGDIAPRIDGGQAAADLHLQMLGTVLDRPIDPEILELGAELRGQAMARAATARCWCAKNRRTDHWSSRFARGIRK